MTERQDPASSTAGWRPDVIAGLPAATVVLPKAMACRWRWACTGADSDATHKCVLAGCTLTDG